MRITGASPPATMGMLPHNHSIRADFFTRSDEHRPSTGTLCADSARRKLSWAAASRTLGCFDITRTSSSDYHRLSDGSPRSCDAAGIKLLESLRMEKVGGTRISRTPASGMDDTDIAGSDALLSRVLGGIEHHAVANRLIRARSLLQITLICHGTPMFYHR